MDEQKENRFWWAKADGDTLPNSKSFSSQVIQRGY